MEWVCATEQDIEDNADAPHVSRSVIAPCSKHCVPALQHLGGKVLCVYATQVSNKQHTCDNASDRHISWSFALATVAEFLLRASDY
jgi:hypothetical protein